MMTATEANDNYPGTIEGEFTVDQNGSAVTRYRCKCRRGRPACSPTFL